MDFDFAAADDAKFGVGKSLLDIPRCPIPEPEPQIPLPFVFVPSQPAEVETSAQPAMSCVWSTGSLRTRRNTALR